MRYAQPMTYAQRDYVVGLSWPAIAVRLLGWPEEAASLGFPLGDYIPRTLEEKIVCFADKMVDSNRVRPFDGEVKRFVKKGHDVPRLLALKKEIEDDLGEDPERLIFDKIKESH